jgi:hypothetical protein
VSLAAEPPPENPPQPANLPVVRFFYYDAGAVEWAVSAEPERLRQHLASNAESQGLFEALSTAVASPVETASSSAQMTRWIEAERQRFEQSRRDTSRIRMAESVIAYLRDHDFDVQKLVEAITRRSGAPQVELVAVHLRDRQGNSSFKLKVVLVDPAIQVGKQGFNIDLPSANVSYTTVAYALGVALYEIQEIVYGEAPANEVRPPDAEQLPAPEPVEPPE